MDYTIKLNAVNNKETKVKAFAAVTLGGCFKIANVAVVEGKEGRLFVSMPSFKSHDANGQTIYKDVCNPITRQFREELYGEILGLYEDMEKAGKTEIIKAAEGKEEPEFSVSVTPYEKEGSSIRGLARVYFDNSFVVGNISIFNGKGKEFVAMPSCRVKAVGKEGKTEFQDICFPVTREFREKLYGEILDVYRREKETVLGEAVGRTGEQMQAEQVLRGGRWLFLKWYALLIEEI